MEKASVKEILNGFNDTKYITPRGAGKIVEAGSNENGHYIKNANGVMECWHIHYMGSCEFKLHSGGLYTDQTNGGYYQWTFPQKFKMLQSLNSSVAVSVTAYSSAYLCTSAGGIDDGCARTNVYYHTNYPCTVGVNLSMRAIGWWK